MYQLAGISTSPVSCPLTSGFIHVSAFIACQYFVVSIILGIIYHLLRIIAAFIHISLSLSSHHLPKTQKRATIKTHMFVHESPVLNQYAS